MIHDQYIPLIKAYVLIPSMLKITYQRSDCFILKSHNRICVSGKS